jgi:hypothetical protein
MKAQYYPVDTFVAVLTPHFLQALQSRSDLLPAMPLSDMFRRCWAVGIENECCGFRFGQGYVYYKCKWHSYRGRWELEFISFTPTNNFHTNSKKFAIEVKP